MVELNYTLLIGSTILVAGIGAIIYYREDLMEMYNYKKEEYKMEEIAKKKIKSKPIDIKINNLNEL
jgi:hypothetical protein